MPGGEELDVELPDLTTGKEIKEELLQAGIAPRNSPDGEAYVYELVNKKQNLRIHDDKTLVDLAVNNGDMLLFIPNLVAGKHT